MLLSLYLTYRNVNIAQENARIANENLRVIEEGKLTDRFSKAVELLGNEKLEIRLGGVYALERIALDSQKDHWTVMEVLTAFVRENSHKESRDVTITEENLATTAEDKFDVDKTKPREDIQAIATVIGRRRWSETESQALDLKSVILTGCNISEATLTRADLREANLVGANLTGANLSGATLLEADLHEAFLNRADLSGANLMEANLDHASLTDANLCGALLVGASLNGAMLTGTILEYTNLYLADLGGARNLELTQVLSAKYEDSILPPKIAEELKEHLSKKAN